MADNWQYYSSYMKTVNWNTLTNNQWGGTVYLHLQYDADYVSVEYLRVRWVLGCGSNTLSGGNSWNYYYLLINPENTAGYWTNRHKYPLKTTWTEGKTAKYPYTGEDYYLKKSSSATTFNIPEVWLCNDGYDVTSPATADNLYNAYRIGATGSLNRPDGLAYRMPVESVSGLGCIVSGPSNSGSNFVFTDNYNNTFSVQGPLGSAGHNNSYNYSNCKLWWTQNKLTASTWSWPEDGTNGAVATFSSGASTCTLSGTLIINNPAAATKEIAACVRTTATYGGSVDKYNSGYPNSGVGIRQYCAPTSPAASGISLTKTKTRLTVREPWTISWGDPAQANSSSPVKGFEVQIKKGNSAITGLSYSNGTVTKGTGSNTTFYIDSASARSITFDPAGIGLAAKDTCSFAIRAFTRYGQNWTGNRLPGSYSTYNIGTIENAAVINEYNAGTWVEKIATVYKNGQWVEADSVLVYKDGNWIESQ